MQTFFLLFKFLLCKFSLFILVLWKQWITFLDSEGRIMDSKALRKIIFYGGVENNLRKEVFPLSLFAWIKYYLVCFIYYSLVIYNPFMMYRFGDSCWDIMSMILHLQRGNILIQWRNLSTNHWSFNGRFDVFIYIVLVFNFLLILL